MIDLQFSIHFDKFNPNPHDVKFSPGINIIYGNSGVGKSIFLSNLQDEFPIHSHNFKIDLKSHDLNYYRIYQNPDYQIIGRTVKSELSFSSECRGIAPSELKMVIDDGLAKLPNSIEPDMNPGLLSGGEKELLNLTTAIQSNPDILIIDDGLSFLSPDNKVLAIESLQSWTSKMNSIVIWASSEIEDITLGNACWILGLNSFQTYDNNMREQYVSIQIPPGELSIELRDVSFQYEFSRQIYSNLNLSLTNSRSVGLLGGNGSGKTTLAGLCFGYLKPQKGEVELSMGRNIDLKIGYADQFPEHLLQLKTPAEFLLDISKNGVFDSHLNHTFKKRLSRFGIQWDTIKDTKGIELPWAVLRTIVVVLLAHCKFDILILDEPTFGLGWDQRVILRAFLRECMSKMHFIIVSHDQYFIQSICDQIIDLDTIEMYVTQIGTEEKIKS